MKAFSERRFLNVVQGDKGAASRGGGYLTVTSAGTAVLPKHVYSTAEPTEAQPRGTRADAAKGTFQQQEPTRVQQKQQHNGITAQVADQHAWRRRGVPKLHVGGAESI